MILILFRKDIYSSHKISHWAKIINKIRLFIVIWKVIMSSQELCHRTYIIEIICKAQSWQYFLEWNFIPMTCLLRRKNCRSRGGMMSIFDWHVYAHKAFTLNVSKKLRFCTSRKWFCDPSSNSHWSSKQQHIFIYHIQNHNIKFICYISIWITP